MTYRFATLAFIATIAVSVAAQAPVLPHPDHVVVVIEENKAYGDVIGSANAPYINSLATAGASLTNYCGLHHPSQPNYVELFSGKELGVCNDTCPIPAITAPNLAASLITAKKGFAGYAEHLPSNPATCSTKSNFAKRHCPWLLFTGLPSSVSLDFSKFPTTAAGFATLPAVTFVIPDLLGDMHTAATSGGGVPSEVAQGDKWLKKNIDAYVKWAATHNSLLVVTWDEDSSSYTYPNACPGISTTPPTNQIPTIIIGQHVVPGSTSATPYTHYNLLRTLENIYGLPLLGGSAGVPPISGIWK